MKARNRILRGIIVWLILLSVVPPLEAQEPPFDPVLEILSQMTPEHKLGQLVLVSFPGTDVSEDSDIAALISDYGLGGVLLTPENGNFGDVPIAPGDLLSMTQQLQMLAWQASQIPVVRPEADAAQVRPYFPLLIAVEAHTAGLPVTAFISETTVLPTSMALGAAWRRDLAEITGRVMGNELAAQGINLLLGPDLDVLYTPRPGDASDLGTDSFGSDPFWVGELGKAYIQGLHRGGEGRMQVVPRHMPGLGSTDRVLREEVPTVQRTLSQLRQIELAPFASVAAGTPGELAVVDAFLVTHIRYRGFLGNIRQTTPPISLDAQALQSVINLDEFAAWREAGGVMVADNLGAPSVHRYYDPRRVSFNARRVSQDAVAAGNDLLILDRFAIDGDWATHFSNIRDALRFLATQYRSDPTFQAIVDDAVYRVISMKLRSYPDLTLEQVLESRPEAPFAEGTSISARVASNALTLIAPLSRDLLPAPPQEGEPIVIFTQENLVEIPGIQPFPRMSADAVENALMHFYGPDGTDVVQPNSVRSFTFEQLHVALEESAVVQPGFDTTPTTQVVLGALRNAQWIIFASTGLDASDPISWALKDFLALQADLLDGRIVVFSFGPPYELDSTEISKLDLYYALYAPAPVFVDVAVRALFRDVLALGNSPVSIPALSYDVSLQTMPDPEQVIPLEIVNEDGELLSQGDIHKGDSVNLRTGKIYDRNGYPVPDGTPVRFVLSYPQEGTERTIVSEALNGIGFASVSLDRVGLLVITVQSEPALSSVSLQLTIPEDQSQEPIIQVVTPTPEPTPSPMPTTPTPEPEEPRVVLLPEPIQLPAPQGSAMVFWGGSGAALVLGLGFFWARAKKLGADSAFRVGGLGAVGALCGYIIVIAIVRWQIPAWHHSMVNREFYLGGVTVLGGVPALLVAMLVELHRRRRVWRKLQRAEEIKA